MAVNNNSDKTRKRAGGCCLNQKQKYNKKRALQELLSSLTKQIKEKTNSNYLNQLKTQTTRETAPLHLVLLIQDKMPKCKGAESVKYLSSKAWPHFRVSFNEQKLQSGTAFHRALHSAF